MARQFVNWSGSLAFTPGGYAEPADEEAVRDLVRRAREDRTKIRPVGSGHSSSPLVRTDGTLLSLDRMAGVIGNDPAAGRATVWAGTKLKALGEGLYDAGLAMDNLGDVDYQSIAGATATGTHGTGLGFGNLSTQVAGVRLVSGGGEILDISARDNPELFAAARLSLGALGVVTRITLHVQPRYELRRRAWCAHVDWTLDHLAELQHTNRNMDFYWYPRSDQTQIRTMNRRDREPDIQPWAAGREPGPGGYPAEGQVGPTHRTIPRHRELRFEEIEYMLPSEAFPACFAEVRRRIRDRHRRVAAWRVLVRTIAADDIALSNAHGRATTTIACLQNSSLPYEEYFRDMEAVFRQYGGRPHWGKKHWLAAGELQPLYPRWDDFQAARRRLDPDGVFLTPDLARLLEEA
ncbi:D-arabinono-1,4-lactone oxidase [Polymorphospora sp. NPDC050346]|uniref:D-arabinono-1,4-lactone oxidase n=1 Tax=Polymorphospora sp. NPDC050346 TaxID=3155780 RepID=UPI0033E8613D